MCNKGVKDMFTNQYITFKKMAFVASSYNEYVTIKDISGTNRKAYVGRAGYGDVGGCMKNPTCANIAASKEAYGTETGVYFGSGSTPATKDDYKLESLITSGLSITESSLYWAGDDNDEYSVSVDYILHNKSSDEINIYEIGAVSFIPNIANTSANNQALSYPFLWERTVLTVPVTLAPGESKLITYKLTLNQTLNVE